MDNKVDAERQTKELKGWRPQKNGLKVDAEKKNRTEKLTSKTMDYNVLFEKQKRD